MVSVTFPSLEICCYAVIYYVSNTAGATTSQYKVSTGLVSRCQQVNELVREV